ncbi:MAG: hypothetical protein EP329_12535 [Deltaproteobacteria bacterium]|nr:MAG: hypothetical protein EP329_12535 [Deltaproteobacteria bacterium]
MNGPRLATLVGALLSFAACGDSGGSSSSDTAGGDVFVNDTAVASDTVVPADTATPVDTATPADTVTPDDTVTPADTVTPDDTSTAQDTVVGDTFSPPDRCEMIGQACSETTQPSADGGLVCLNGDSLNPEVFTCHLVCEASTECLATQFCASLDDSSPSVCLTKNCTSTFASATECAAASDTGGHCVPLGDSGGYCIPAGTGAPGATCEGDGECAPGALCVNRTCAAACNLTGSPGCGDGAACQDFGLSGGVGFCLDYCPGFTSAPGTCGEGFGCQPTGPTNGYCSAVGTLSAGQECGDSLGTCGEFLFCTRVQSSDPSRCEPMCDRTAPELGDSQCATGETCAELDEIHQIGACFPGCQPFVAESANGCTEDGRKLCLPIDDGSHALCLGSGAVPIGGACTAGDDCQGDAFCERPSGETTGTCKKVCKTFDASQSGCAENEVCSMYQTSWGVCSADVANPRIQPLSPCSTPGQWCDEASRCFTVDNQGNALCIPFCRPTGGNADCPQGLICETGFFEGDAFGLCLPQ